VKCRSRSLTVYNNGYSYSVAHTTLGSTFDVVEIEKNLGDDDSSVKKNDHTQKNLDRVALIQTKTRPDLVVEEYECGV